MQIELLELKNIMQDTAELTATAMLVKSGKLSSALSKREAYREYGEGVVNRWIAEGLVKVRKDGNNTAKCRLNRVELESVAKANNRTTYITTAERAEISNLKNKQP